MSESSKSRSSVIRFICTPFLDVVGKHILQEGMQEGQIYALLFLRQKGSDPKVRPERNQTLNNFEYPKK